MRLLRFVVAGGIGFVADAAMLALLIAATPIDPFTARLCSIAFALTVTWLINRRFTFGPSGRAMMVEGARYGGVGIATSVANYLIYSAVLLVFPAAPPLVALTLASTLAMALSYLGYSRLVFGR